MKLKILDIAMCLVTVIGFHLATDKDGIWKSIGYFAFFLGISTLIELRTRAIVRERDTNLNIKQPIKEKE